MKYLLTLMLAPLLVALAPATFAQGPQDCTQIKDPDARLACYDNAYQSRGKKAPSPAAQETSPSSTDSAPEDRPIVERRIDDATAPNARPGRAAPATEKPRSRGMFSRSEKVNFTATIKAVRARDQQRMVFLLDNEQVWMQSNPRILGLAKGDQVTIKSGLIGGFMMRNEKGVGTRVQRIK